MKFFSLSTKNKSASGTDSGPNQCSGSVPPQGSSWANFEKRNASRTGRSALSRLSKSTSNLPIQPGWTADQPALPPIPSRYAPQPGAPPPNIVVNQHYYIAAPTTSYNSSGRQGRRRRAEPHASTSRLNLGSVVNLATDILPMDVPHFFDDGLPSWHAPGSRLLNQGAACYDQLTSKFNNVMTLIDGDGYKGNERELFTYDPQPSSHAQASVKDSNALTLQPTVANKSRHDLPQKGQTTAVATTLISGNYFAKVDLYANSKLPPNLPPVRLYIATYPLLSLAAQYSDRVYQQPKGLERFTHIDADWKTGTKAMVIKSVPMDHANTIVFAVRGTATFMDWAVNLNMSPASPTGFLDDLGNFCHAGFLSVARKMIRPVAARLRQLLEENPNRASYSLLITGHSAGGAVAALLYSHMLSTSKQAESELNLLTGCFRRIHCITFGTPPVSLLPLEKPDRRHLRKSLFLSFVNEGDPVARADKAYVKSLLELFRAPAPTTPRSKSREPSKEKSKSSLHLPSSSKTSKPSKSHHGHSRTKQDRHSDGRRSHRSQKPVWNVPAATLSNAGRLIVLRSGNPRAEPTSRKTVEERLDEGVVAQITTDEQLRSVIWGDPVCHVMKLYAGRIETLAIGAVTVPQ